MHFVTGGGETRLPAAVRENEPAFLRGHGEFGSRSWCAMTESQNFPVRLNLTQSISFYHVTCIMFNFIETKFGKEILSARELNE